MIQGDRKPQSELLSNRFELLEEVGRGAFGAVYRALDRQWDTTVALKTLQAWDPDALLRFKREFRYLQDIVHPNLVRLRELVNQDGSWFFTMELVQGVDFMDHVRPFVSRDESGPGRRARTLDIPRLRAALAQLVDGLCAIHAAGHAHCDIKPSNIMVEDEGRVVLLDFGLLAQLQQHNQTTDGHVVGTAEYMSPEQARGEPITPASDWYAMGSLLYETLVGHPPFLGKPMTILRAKQYNVPMDPRELSPYAPEDLSELCMELLAVEPASRPSDAQLRSLLVAANDGYRPSMPVPSARSTDCFVGRQQETEVLEGRLARTVGGEAGFVYISGESGVGKTALAQRFTRRAAKRARTMVLQARCYERETVPFKAFDGIVDDLAAYIAGLPERQRERLLEDSCAGLATAFPVFNAVLSEGDRRRPAPAKEPHVQRLEAFGALRGVLRRLAEQRLLILMVDDLQWADPDSLHLLRELLEPDDGPCCLILATGRPMGELSAELVDQLQEILALELATTVNLQGLDEAETSALLGHWRDRAPDTIRVRAILGETRGNPLFISELAREPMLQPGSMQLSDALAERVESLGESAQELLELLATAGMPLPHRLLAEVVGLDHTSLDRELAGLRQARLARSAGQDREECYHDRVRDSAVTRLDTSTGRMRHRQLAAALSQHDEADAELLGDLWEGAGELLRARRLRLKAARAAVKALAFNRAVRLFSRALESADAFDARELPELRVEHAEALSCAGFAAEAAHLLLKVADDVQVERRSELRRRAAQLLLRSAQLQPGLELSDALLAEVGLSRAKSPGVAVGRMLWERTRMSMSSVQPAPSEGAVEAQQQQRLQTLWAIAPPLALVDVLGGNVLQTQYSRLALRSGDTTHAGRALATEAIILSVLVRPPNRRLSQVIEQARNLSERCADPYLEGLCALAAGVADLCAFRAQQALKSAQRAVEIFREQCVDVAWETTNARMTVLNAHWNLGNLREHATLSREWLRDARDRGDRYALAQLNGPGLAYFSWLHMDDTEAALHSLDESLDGWWLERFQMPQWCQYIGRQLVGLYRADGSAYRLLHATGPAMRRSQLLRVPYMAQYTHCDAAWATLEHARTSDSRGVEALLAETETHLRALRRTRWPLSEPLANQIQGQVAWLRDDPDTAVALLRQAHGDFRTADSVYQHPTGYLLGGIVGGAEGTALRQSALAWCAGQNIAHPRAMLATFVPVLGED